MLKDSIQPAALRRAMTLAGGVSFLSHKLGITANDLDAMLQHREPVPHWVFLRAVDYLNEADSRKDPPPGFPAKWETPDGDTGT
jgi:hypothetical protein